MQLSVPLHACNPLVLKYAAIILQCENVIKIAKFYDRDPTITDWYYQAYAAEFPIMPNTGMNSIVNILKKPRAQQAVGNVLIMKNGPMHASWERSPNVNIPSLAQTIWWYRGSGQDVSTVFGERGLRHIIANMQN
jgi:hypothetical protein